MAVLPVLEVTSTFLDSESPSMRCREAVGGGAGCPDFRAMVRVL